MWIIKALVVAESVEWTRVRYMLSVSFEEWVAEIDRNARGLYISIRDDGWYR